MTGEWYVINPHKLCWHQPPDIAAATLRPITHACILPHPHPRRIKVLWRDAVMVTDPEAVATICGRGPGSLDKASAMYFPINQMCEPAGHANLLTSPSDERWKAVRKAVAAAFSVHHIKAKLPVVVASTDELVGRLRALGPQASVDVDQVGGGGLDVLGGVCVCARCTCVMTRADVLYLWGRGPGLCVCVGGGRRVDGCASCAGSWCLCNA